MKRFTISHQHSTAWEMLVTVVEDLTAVPLKLFCGTMLFFSDGQSQCPYTVSFLPGRRLLQGCPSRRHAFLGNLLGQGEQFAVSHSDTEEATGAAIISC